MKIQASITIPYAVANYAEMRDRGFYYVDKTDYIPRLEAYKAPVFSLAEHTSEAIPHRSATGT